MRVVVIGAGLAGLAAADALHRERVEVQVLEARGRVGGRAFSVPFAGGVIERGGEFVLPGNSELTAVAARLGLSLIRKGTLYGNRTPAGGAPVSPDAVRAAATELAQAPSAPGDTLDVALARSGLAPGIADAIRARLEVSCAYPAADLAASVLAEGSAAFGDFDTHTVAGGNQRLAEALAAAVGDDRVRLASPVTAVSWSQTGVSAVTAAATESADAAIIAVPASVIDRIEFDPPLPADKAGALAGVRYGHAAKLFVGLREPAAPSAVLSVPDRFWCFTQLAAEGQPAPFAAAFAGTPQALERLEVSAGPERWLAALRTLRPDLALDEDVVELSTWADDPWVAGAYSAFAASSPLDHAELARPVPPLAFAGEHTAGAWHGTMEGAIRSGIRAALQVLKKL